MAVLSWWSESSGSFRWRPRPLPAILCQVWFLFDYRIYCSECPFPKVTVTGFNFSDGHFRSGNFYRFYFSERQLRICNKLPVTGFIPQNLTGDHFGQHSRSSILYRSSWQQTFYMFKTGPILVFLRIHLCESPFKISRHRVFSAFLLHLLPWKKFCPSSTSVKPTSERSLDNFWCSARIFARILAPGFSVAVHWSEFLRQKGEWESTSFPNDQLLRVSPEP